MVECVHRRLAWNIGKQSLGLLLLLLMTHFNVRILARHMGGTTRSKLDGSSIESKENLGAQS